MSPEPHENREKNLTAGEGSEEAAFEELLRQSPGFAQNMSECLRVQRTFDDIGELSRDTLSKLMTQDGADASPHLLPALIHGDYKVLREIGRGGMGVVYEAWQLSLDRSVALKLIKVGMDTEEVVSRFESERQTLAVMKHPNIAEIYGAGSTEEGRPYFVMELVNGIPITSYCDRQGLQIKGRLDLFLQLCDAVQHAHHKGIIHRDLKPSNVLVTECDGGAVPKVIDFGVAKATHQGLGERRFLTETGHRVGTPEYMSPEQVGGVDHDLDTRSDIYSLGVLLYELLSGALPFDSKFLRKKGYAEIQRIIRDVEPPKPSTRHSSLGDATGTIAGSRRTGPARPSKELGGDLDAITMQAMAKTREARYATASELAADIRRYLNHEPIVAAPPGLAYRASKFVRKHRGLVVATGAVLVSLIAGMVLSIALYLRAERHAAEAQRHAEDARAKTAVAEAAREEAQVQTYLARIGAAKLRFDDGNIAGALADLEACPEESRGWEWSHLSLASDLSLAVVEAEAGVRSVAFSPDESYAVCSSNDKKVRIVDPSAGKVLRTLVGHTRPVLSVAVSPDSQHVASAGDDRTIRLWDPQTTRAGPVLRGHEASVKAVVFGPDGKRLLSGDAAGALRLWDVESGRTVHSVAPDGEKIRALAFSPDGRAVVSGSERARLRVWDAERLTLVRTVEGHTHPIHAVAYSPDGERIFSGSLDRTVRVWDSKRGTPLAVFPQASAVHSLASSPDGEHLAVGLWREAGVAIVDAESGEVVRSLNGHIDTVLSVNWSSTGGRIFSGSRDGTARLWHGATGQASHELVRHRSKVGATAFSPDGRRIAVASVDRTLSLWDAGKGRLLRVLRGHADEVTALVFSAEGQRLASGSLDQTIRLWDVETGDLLSPVVEIERTIVALDFATDRQRLVCASENRVAIWNLETRQHRDDFEEAPGTLACIRFHPDGTRIFGGAMSAPGRVPNRPIWVWDTASGRLVSTLAGHASTIASMAFHSNGKVMVSGGCDSRLMLWNLESGERILQLAGHTGFVLSVGFSPDGERVVSGACDRSVRVWDARNGALLMSLREHSDSVHHVTFSPDGRRILSAAEDGEVRVWESELDDAVEVWDAQAEGPRDFGHE